MRTSLIGAVLSLAAFASPAAAAPELRFVVLRLADPPTAVRVAAERAAGRPMPPDAQRAWTARLAAAQVPLEAELAAAGVPVVARLQRTVNGLLVRAPASELPRLASLPGVVGVAPALTLRPALASSVPHIGATILASELGLDGAGVDIGVIDSGVDYLHAAFGGPASPEAYSANDPTIIGDSLDGAPLFPTAKVVGGTDFVGESYDAETYDLPEPDPDPMPSYNKIDPETGEITAYDEHGTHVAATAAGFATADLAPGVAPGARIWALKVFGQGSTNVTTAAIEWAADPDGDGDLSDALDVLNLSLGTGFSGAATTSAEQLALDAFVGLGGVVVAAAGNEGDLPFVHSAPGSYASVISVANSYGPGETGTFVVVDEPSPLAGSYPARQASKQFAPSLSTAGPLTGALVYAGDGCEAADFPAEVAGQLALIDRGGCTFTVKLGHAGAAGAVGAVVINHEDGEPISMSGEPPSPIPGVMLWKETGDPIRAAILEGEALTATVGAGLPNPKLADVVNPGSSRGPGYGAVGGAEGVLCKPDVAAPGSHIRAARAGTGVKTKSKTGTSMASPHVAGLAALLRQAHPEWTPRDIKARLVTTAAAGWLPGNPALAGKGGIAPVARGGAGTVDGVAAVAGDLVAAAEAADPLAGVAVDLGHHALTAPLTLTRTVIVRNGGDASKELDAAFAWRTGEPKGGVTLTVDPATLAVPPGGEASLTVTVALDPAALAPWTLANRAPDEVHMNDAAAFGAAEIDGWVVLTGAETLRVPLYGLARPVANAHVTDACLSPGGATLTLENDGAVDGWTEAFTLLAEDPDEPGVWDGADIRAVGARAATLGGEPALQIALVTWGPRVHPTSAALQVYLDADADGTADFVLVVRFDDWPYGQTQTGRPVGLLYALGGEELTPVDQQYVVSDLLSARLVLTVPLEALGLEDLDAGVRLWALSTDRGSEGGAGTVDLVPDGLNVQWITSQPKALVAGGACSEWRLAAPGFPVAGDVAPQVTAAPTCASGQGGLLLLHENAPGTAEADVVAAPAVDVSAACAAQLDLSVPADGCTVELDAADLVTAQPAVEGPCALNLSLEALEPAAVGPGDTPVAVRFRDALGRAHDCTSVVRVTPQGPPTVTCPDDPVDRGALPWEAPIAATGTCGVTIERGAVTCVGAADEATGCEVWVVDGALRVAYVDPAATAVDVGLVATDGAGQVTEVTCTLPVAAPKPAEDAGPKGGAPDAAVAGGADAPDAGPGGDAGDAGADVEQAAESGAPGDDGCSAGPAPSPPLALLASLLACLPGITARRARRRSTPTRRSCAAG